MTDKTDARARKLYDRIFNAIADDGSQQAEDDCIRIIAEALAEQPAGAVGDAWAEGYAAGVTDERISEANIGIAGYGAKVEPARENPYTRATSRAEQEDQS